MSDLKFQRMRGDTPLARLVNTRRADPAISRLRLKHRLFEGLFFHNEVLSEATGRLTLVGGRELLNFSSHNFFAVDQHPSMTAALSRSARIWGRDSSYSRHDLTHEAIQSVESEWASSLGCDRALLFASDVELHHAVVPVLFGSPDVRLFVDVASGAGMYQAARAARGFGARITVLDPAELTALSRELHRAPAGTRVLLCSSRNVETGARRDVRELARICVQTGSILYLDDSLNLGLSGVCGGGSVEEARIGFENLILTASLDAGFGTSGAVLAGRTEWIELLPLLSRAADSPRSARGLQPSSVEMARIALRLVRGDEGSGARLRLQTIARKVRSDLTALGFAVEGEPESPFLFVRTAGEMRALIAARKLLGHGVLVKPVTFAGSRRDAGLLAVLTVLHDEHDLAQLIAAFARLGGGLSMSSLTRELTGLWRKGALAASRVDRRLSGK